MVLYQQTETGDDSLWWGKRLEMAVVGLLEMVVCGRTAHQETVSEAEMKKGTNHCPF